MKLGEPWWYRRVDAWFKLLASIVLGYVILARLVGWLVDFGDVTVIAVGGVLLAYLVLPAVSLLNQRLPLWAALTIVYVLIGGLLTVSLWLLVPAMVVQFNQLVADIPLMQKTMQSYLSTTHNPFVTRLPPSLRGYVAKVPAQIAVQMQMTASGLSARALGMFVSLVKIGAIAFAIPVVSLYMLAESPVIKRFFARLFAAERRPLAVDVLGDVDAVIGGFVRGQLIVAAVVGGLATGALLVLHVPYAVLIGAWAGIADVVPYIGPFAGGIPAALVALVANGWPNMVLVVIAFTAINQLEAHLLGPRIVSGTVKVTPLAVIFAIMIGAHVMGLLGVLIAVPVAGLVRVALVRLFPEEEITNAEIRPGLTHAPQTDVDPEATEA